MGTGIHGGGKCRVNGGKTYRILSHSNIYGKVKQVENKLNKEKSCGEQYPCMRGMCPRWPVMHGERIPCMWGVAV